MKLIIFAIFAVIFLNIVYGIPRTAPDFSDRTQQNMRNRFKGRIVGGTPGKKYFLGQFFI